MQKENDILETPSEEVQEILDHTPHWLIRNGISIVFVILLITITASFFIRYPIYIKAKALITSSNPPVDLVASESGRIIPLKKDGEQVKNGDYLAVIENPAETEDVIALKNSLTGLSGNNFDDFSLSEFERPLQLGGVQLPFSRFTLSLKQYRQLIETGFFEEKQMNSREQAVLFQEVKTRLQAQNKLIEQELDISAKKFLKQQELYVSGLISKGDLEQAQLEYFQKKQALKGNELARLNSLLNEEKNKGANLDSKHFFVEAKQSLRIELVENYKLLLGAISSWEQQFVLKAPFQGIVAFSKPYTAHQNVERGEQIVSVDPQQSNLKALVFIPQQNSGKVHAGLSVHIKLFNYPPDEYGYLIGRVSNISATSLNNNLLVEVSLPKGLKTSYDKQVTYQQGLEGDAEIITDNLLLFSRIFNQIDKK